MTKSLPNYLTLARIAAIPAIVAVLFLPGGGARFWALGLFLAAGFTDFLDGWLARRLRAFSRFGTMLDPIADKSIVAAVLVMLCAQGVVSGVHTVAVLVILGRELAISGLREFLAADRIALPVSRLAKWKTAVQMAAVAALLWPAAPESAVRAAALALLWIAAFLSGWTGISYMAGTYRHWRLSAEAES